VEFHEFHESGGDSIKPIYANISIFKWPWASSFDLSPLFEWFVAVNILYLFQSVKYYVLI